MHWIKRIINVSSVKEDNKLKYLLKLEINTGSYKLYGNTVACIFVNLEQVSLSRVNARDF